MALADSICSDDLNVIEYPKRAYEMLGPFKMGGLTGMGAFAHHVPADGAVFVFYGLHIGVSRAGVPGDVLRPGQSTLSACRGAAKAALDRLLRGEIQPGHITKLDYQQNTIEQIFLAQGPRILAAANPIVEATEVMYEAIEARIDLLASRTIYPCRYVILLGAVLINADPEVGAFASHRRLHVLDSATGTHESLLAELLATHA